MPPTVSPVLSALTLVTMPPLAQVGHEQIEAAPLAQVGHEQIEAAELEVAAEDGSDRLCFRLIDRNPAILRVIAERCHAADPETLALGGGDLVADALGGDLALELGK